MTRPKNKPRYRIKRTDVFSHAKTRGMRTGSHAIMDYAMAQNILGIVRESPKSIASHFEDFSAPEFHRSLRVLVLRGIARWWPEYDIIWIVECLDEQSFSEDSDRGALPIMAKLPDPVRAAVALRYGARVEGGGHPPGSPSSRGAGADAPQKSRRAELLRSSPPTPSPESPDTPSEPESPSRASARAVLAKLSAYRIELVPNARVLKATDTNLALILARLNEGEPVEDLLLVVDHSAHKVRTGGDSHWLNSSTPFRPSNWPRCLAEAQAWKAGPRRPGGANGRQYDATPDEVRARLAAAGEPEAGT